MDRFRIEPHLIKMMRMQFTQWGRQARDRGMLPEGASATDITIAQLLWLAQSAGFRFDVVDGRLVTISATPDWRLWPTLRALLDDIGVDAIVSYFERTTQERRVALSAAAS
jgi:hypothetical protein